ncbi:MAG: hypothetical protein MHM6MM_005831 [Cercozoa sp. M6MM]
MASRLIARHVLRAERRRIRAFSAAPMAETDESPAQQSAAATLSVSELDLTQLHEHTEEFLAREDGDISQGMAFVSRALQRFEAMTPLDADSEQYELLRRTCDSLIRLSLVTAATEPTAKASFRDRLIERYLLAVIDLAKRTDDTGLENVIQCRLLLALSALQQVSLVEGEAPESLQALWQLMQRTLDTLPKHGRFSEASVFAEVQRLFETYQPQQPAALDESMAFELE